MAPRAAKSETVGWDGVGPKHNVEQYEQYTPCGTAHVQYLEMIDDVMRNGVFRGDRTGTGTYSKFGTTMRFNLRHSFPLLTTKRVFWRGG